MRREARPNRRFRLTFILALAVFGSPFGSRDLAVRYGFQTPPPPVETVSPAARDHRRAVLWREPTNIADRDLFFGPGGEEHQPDVHDTFTFIKEDLAGSHPKFDVRDNEGVRRKVKLGTEARPETAASRLVWAAGYFTDQDYFVDQIRVREMPPRMHRGQQFVD